MRAVLALIFISCQALQVSAGTGTTKGLQNIVKSRCDRYSGSSNKCDRLVDLFINAFKGKAHCQVKPYHFQPFIDEALKPGRRRGILWSQTQDVATYYGERSTVYVVVNKLLPGAMIDSLIFCGSTSSGIDYNSCPDYNGCGSKTSAVKAFWSMISKRFAESLEGEVPLLLNGSSGVAYNMDSIFNTHELPNLNPRQVTVVHAIVLHHIGQAEREDCNSGTLLKLRIAVQNRGLKYKCVENPKDIGRLLHADGASIGPVFKTTVALILAVLYFNEV